MTKTLTETELQGMRRARIDAYCKRMFHGYCENYRESMHWRSIARAVIKSKKDYYALGLRDRTMISLLAFSILAAGIDVPNDPRFPAFWSRSFLSPDRKIAAFISKAMMDLARREAVR